MLRYFDMMYYFLATFYKKFSKKRSSWEMQAIFVVSVTQMALLMDLYAFVTVNLLCYKGSFSFGFKILIGIVALLLFFLNVKRYEKKYLQYNKLWGDYVGVKKAFLIFLVFFTVVFAWCFIFVLALFDPR